MYFKKGKGSFLWFSYKQFKPPTGDEVKGAFIYVICDWKKWVQRILDDGLLNVRTFDQDKISKASRQI